MCDTIQSTVIYVGPSAEFQEWCASNRYIWDKYVQWCGCKLVWISPFDVLDDLFPEMLNEELREASVFSSIILGTDYQLIIDRVLLVFAQNTIPIGTI